MYDYGAWLHLGLTEAQNLPVGITKRVCEGSTSELVEHGLILYLEAIRSFNSVTSSQAVHVSKQAQLAQLHPTRTARTTETARDYG